VSKSHAVKPIPIAEGTVAWIIIEPEKGQAGEQRRQVRSGRAPAPAIALSKDLNN
jgi:hypothetical protein